MKKPTNKAKSRIAVTVSVYIVVSGNILFFLFIDDVVGIKTTIGQVLMIIFFWAWLGFLFHIEKKYFKGLYEQWKK